MTMQQILNALGRNGHVLVILIAVSFSVLSVIAKRIKAAAEERRRAIQRDQREIERIRTGRDPMTGGFATSGRATPQATAAVSAKQSLEEIAAKRRARLEEMRRGGGVAARPPVVPSVLTPTRASAGQTQGDVIGAVLGQILGVPGGVAGRPTGRAPGAPSRSVPTGTPTAGGRAPMRPGVPRAQARVATPSATMPTASPGIPPPIPVSRAPAPRPAPTREAEPHAVHRLVPDVDTYQTGDTRARIRGAARIFGQEPTGAEWRRALLLREILAPPMSMRDAAADVA